MKQRHVYIDKEKQDHVCKLRRSIYGLKQAARCWNNAIDEFFKASGYVKSSTDTCLYVKSQKDDSGEINFVILALYVDDILLLSNNTHMMKREKDSLSERFQIIDQGEAHFLLGMMIKRNRKQKILSISQPRYLEGILKRFNMENCKSVTTPLEQGRKYQKLNDEDLPVETHKYQMIIGSLTYASTATRPDIAAAVGTLSKFMSKPGKEHWEGIKRVLRYIKGTVNHGLIYSANINDTLLQEYSDADWAGDVDTRRSTSGYVYQIFGNTVSWSSKSQNSVAKSSTESEYIALSTASQEAIWLRRLLMNIGYQAKDPTTLFEDNQSTIEMSKNPKYHNRTKHIDVLYHFIREHVNAGKIAVKYCNTKDMIADIMTKGLGKTQFEKLRGELGVNEIN